MTESAANFTQPENVPAMACIYEKSIVSAGGVASVQRLIPTAGVIDPRTIQDEKKYPSLRGGICITNAYKDGMLPSPGTLGCLAYYTNPDNPDDPDNGWVMLTNEHVINNGDLDPHAKVGQPSYQKCCCAEMNVVGKMILYDKALDCAIASIAEGVIWKNTIEGYPEGIKGSAALKGGSPIFAVAVGDIVTKRGKRTLLTTGTVVELDPSDSTFRVQSNNEYSFIEHGDSGSAVLNANNEVVGLVYGSVGAGTYTEDPYGDPIEDLTGEAWCVAIQPVLAAMHIEIRASEAEDLRSDDADGDRADRARSQRMRKRNLAANKAAKVGAEIGFEFGNRGVWTQFKPLWEENGEEILHLINHHRAVKVGWQRNKGPAFVALLLAQNRNPEKHIPEAVEGVHRETMILQMAALLQAHGSKKMGEAIAANTGKLLRQLRTPIADLEFATGNEIMQHG
jgi:Trypsin-like peptidase domain